MKRNSSCLILFGFVLVMSPCIAWATDFAFTVDPQVAVGADYTSLNAWESAQNQDLTAAGGHTMTVTCTSGDGSDDNAQCQVIGWATASGNDITIIGGDFPVDAVWDDAAYVLKNDATPGRILYIREEFVNVENLQIISDSSGGGFQNCIEVDFITTGGIISIESCIIRQINTSTGRGILVNDADVTVNIFNTIIEGWNDDGNSSGMFMVNGVCNLLNCTFYNCWNAVNQSAGTLTVKNSAVATNTNDFNGTITIDYCASDDGDGTNAQDAVSGDWDNEFTDANNLDFSLVSGGNCINNGTDDPGSGLYSDDIIDVARSSTWDIGAFEFVAAPVEVGQFIMIMSSGSIIVAFIAFSFWISERKAA